MKLVSVIIPYYKKIKFIEDCIVSVLKQTYKKIEILIIYDDPSNKDLKKILQLKKRDKRIKIIKIKLIWVLVKVEILALKKVREN